MDKPAALLFDMDGLLLDSERLFVGLGISIVVEGGRSEAEADAFFRTLVGSNSKQTRDRLYAFLGSETAGEAFLVEWHRVLEAEIAANGVPVKPGVREGLDQLKGQGARMAVVTSTKGKNARHHLDVAGLLPFFEQVTGGDEVSANKPHPAPYLEAATGLGLRAHDCAAFEDSDPGTTAAVRAGCTVVQIPDLRPQGQPYPKLGQHIAPDFWAALRLLNLV